MSVSGGFGLRNRSDSHLTCPLWTSFVGLSILVCLPSTQRMLTCGWLVACVQLAVPHLVSSSTYSRLSRRVLVNGLVYCRRFRPGTRASGGGPRLQPRWGASTDARFRRRSCSGGGWARRRGRLRGRATAHSTATHNSTGGYRRPLFNTRKSYYAWSRLPPSSTVGSRGASRCMPSTTAARGAGQR